MMGDRVRVELFRRIGMEDLLKPLRSKLAFVSKLRFIVTESTSVTICRNIVSTLVSSTSALRTQRHISAFPYSLPLDKGLEANSEIMLEFGRLRELRCCEFLSSRELLLR